MANEDETDTMGQCRLNVAPDVDRGDDDRSSDHGRPASVPPHHACQI